jgi:uncharacterized protein
MTVTQLWRYPVKSMAGEQADRLEVLPDGVAGDRMLALTDTVTGKIISAKREPRLLQATARWDGARVEIRLPGPVTLDAADPAAPGLLSQWLGRPVGLSRAPGGTFVDEAPVHVLSEQALAQGRRWYPDGNWAVARFRPNILVAGPQPDPASLRDRSVSAIEDSWTGSLLTAGGALLRATGRCKRCVMVGTAQQSLPKDAGVLRTLARRNDLALGIYAAIAVAGPIVIGDELCLAGRAVTSCT